MGGLLPYEAPGGWPVLAFLPLETGGNFRGTSRKIRNKEGKESR